MHSHRGFQSLFKVVQCNRQKVREEEIMSIKTTLANFRELLCRSQTVLDGRLV